MVPMRIAVLEADTIDPQNDAGARAVSDLLVGVKDKGHRARAVSDLLVGLNDLGHRARAFVEADPAWRDSLAGFEPEMIVVSRPGLFLRLLPVLKPLGVPLVYLAHDLHFVRVGLQADITGGVRPGAVRVLRMVEQQCFQAADLAILPTGEEAERAVREFPGCRVVAMNYFSMPEQPLPISAPESDQLVFVGGSFHAPNKDGIDWFVRQVLPSVRTERPTRLAVCGRWGMDAQPLQHEDGVEFTGPLSESDLNRLLAGARAGLAPLRFGAGMKRKTLHYLSHGLPVVGTTYSIEGLSDGGNVPGVLLAHTVPQWCDALRALQDTDTWSATSAAGAAFVRSRFSRERYLDGVSSALHAVG
jgi:glycosyltransferase involved in cell wall biosynthesis